MASTLRTAIRTISKASAPSPWSARTDSDMAKNITALETMWRALETTSPWYREWFRKGLAEEGWARFQELANQLPSLPVKEREELIALTRRGLRLDRQSPTDTEREIPDVELDAPL